MSEQQNNAVVIGAGIVGVCTAFELSKSGYNVTVIEKFPLAGQFCSMGNAGVIRDHSAPPFKSVAPHSSTASLIWNAFKSTLPTFKPHYQTFGCLDPYFFTDITCNKWVYAFFKSKIKKKNNQQLLDVFDQYCLHSYISNSAEIKNITDYDFLSNTGYAQIIPTSKSISNVKHAKNLYGQLSVPKLLQVTNTNTNIDQLSTTTPTQNTIDTIAVEHYPHSWIGDCHKFSNFVKTVTMNDINFRFNSEAQQILIDKNNNVYGVEIDNNEIIKADKIIICAGVLTNNIIQNKIYQMNGKIERKKLKLPHVPIVPLQGFSISIPYPKCKYKFPFSSTVYYPTQIYVSRINDNILRFSNYGYFRNTKYAMKKWNNMQDVIEAKEGIQNNVIDASKFENMLLDNLENCIKNNLLSLYDINEKYFDENKIIWTGFRPYTPDTLPIVDEIKGINGLYVNAGHGMLGWGTSHGTAKLLVSKINNETDETQSELLKLLSIHRF
eukprot:431559_1